MSWRKGCRAGTFEIAGMTFPPMQSVDGRIHAREVQKGNFELPVNLRNARAGPARSASAGARLWIQWRTISMEYGSSSGSTVIELGMLMICAHSPPVSAAWTENPTSIVHMVPTNFSIKTDLLIHSSMLWTWKVQAQNRFQSKCWP